MNNFTGGPAFPVIGEHGFKMENSEGMTLRDYFAAQAMAGIAKEPGEGCAGYIKQRARIAYAIADAMLKARNE